MTDEKKFARAKAIATLECMAIDLTGALAGLAKTNPMADVLEQRIEAIDTAQAALREQPRWISVEERLPEIEMHGTSRVVLAWEPDHGRCFAMVYDNGQGKRWFSGGVEIPNITHWMPLPEPPEVEV